MTNDNTTSVFAEGYRLELAAQIVMSYVSNNVLPAGALPGLIRSVHDALAEQQAVSATAEPDVEKPSAAAIKKSITPDALISFINGKPYKALKRHLGTHGLDIHGYRERYGLPADYPSVSANYSAARSTIAKDLGLGQQGRNRTAA